MDTIQLTTVLQNDPYTGPLFLGVFARDQLPEITKKPCLFVFNTDVSTSNGEHWIAVYMNNYSVEHFDPLGHPPASTMEDYYMENNMKRVIYPSYHVQDPKAITCGLHCLYFLWHRARGVTLSRMLTDYYSCNLDLNESLILLFNQTLKY